MARLILSKIGARTGWALLFSPDAMRALLSHDWPGNGRENENALEFAITVCRGQAIQPEDQPPEVLAAAHSTSTGGTAPSPPRRSGSPAAR